MWPCLLLEYPTSLFLLIRRLYEAFGLSKEAIPRAYDRDTGRLCLPS